VDSKILVTVSQVLLHCKNDKDVFNACVFVYYEWVKEAAGVAANLLMDLM